MAARRLIAVMLVLLFLSSLAAALAPVERREDTSTTSTDPVTEAVEVPSGELVRATLEAGGRQERPKVRASVGDQLQLRVVSGRVATIVLVELGPTEDVGPLAPALFDVLLEDEGRFPVRELESERTLGVIVVSPRAPREPAPDQPLARS